MDSCDTILSIQRGTRLSISIIGFPLGTFLSLPRAFNANIGATNVALGTMAGHEGWQRAIETILAILVCFVLHCVSGIMLAAGGVSGAEGDSGSSDGVGSVCWSSDVMAAVVDQRCSNSSSSSSWQSR